VPAPSPLRQDALDRGLADQHATANAAVGRLLQIAQQLIRRGETVDLNLRQLIDESGVGTRFFYRYFPSKEAFLLILLEDVFATLASQLTGVLAAASDARDGVVAWVEGLLDQADPDTAALGRPLLVQAPRLNQQFPDAYRAVGQAMLVPLAETIASGVAQGTLQSRDPAADARAIFFLTLSVMQSHVMERSTPSPQERTHLAGFALRALGAELADSGQPNRSRRSSSTELNTLQHNAIEEQPTQLPHNVSHDDAWGSPGR